MTTIRTNASPRFGVAERLKNVAPSSTLAITAKAKELKTQGKPVISLAAGEPDFPAPPEIHRAMIVALDQNFTKYTPTSGVPELKDAVLAKIKRDQGLAIARSNVCISCGAKHALYNIFQATLNPGDEVIIPRPYWVSYPDMIHLAGGVPVPVDTSGNRYIMTRDLIEKAITLKTRIVVLNSPSNPTGAVLSENHVKDIAALIQERALYCISDEI